MESLPDRLCKIVAQTIDSINWNSFGCDSKIVFHYSYHNCQFGGWTVIVYPAIHEVVFGKDDGALIYPKFNISIIDIMKHFDDITDLVFVSQESKFCIDGIVGDMLFSLEILEKPPSNAKVTRSYNIYTKKIAQK